MDENVDISIHTLLEDTPTVYTVYTFPHGIPDSVAQGVPKIPNVSHYVPKVSHGF